LLKKLKNNFIKLNLHLNLYEKNKNFINICLISF